MSSKIQYELGILTNDGWVVTLVTDKEVTFGDTIIKSIIVQPKEDFIKSVEQNPDVPLRLYQLNHLWEVAYDILRDGPISVLVSR